MPRNRRNLTVEALEVRKLLSATPSPAWFQKLPEPAALATDVALPSVATITWKGADAEVRPGEWIVQFSDEVTARMSSAADAAVELPNAPFALRVDGGLGLPGMVKLDTTASATQMGEWLSSVPNLQWYEPNFISKFYIEEPNDPGYEFSYALDNQGYFPNSIDDADMDVYEAWDITTGDPDTIVGVTDSGVNYLHEDLADNMWVNPGEIPGNERDDDDNGFVDDIYGWDFGEGDADPMDEMGHGTQVAGTLGAVGNNGVGITGVNWNTSIMALKIAGADGNLVSSAIVEAINYAAMMRLRGVNVRVTNHSYGGPNPSDAQFNAVLAQRNADILFVTAAGNDAENSDRVGNFPNNYTLDNILSVAATDPADAMALFSNFGVNSVDVGAPGDQIISTDVNGGYSYTQGTSFSSPYTAGVAALVGAHAPTATYDKIRQAIIDGADRIPSLNGKVFSGARVNAFNALKRIEQLAPAVAVISGNNQVITDGDLSPTAADNTDFGSLSAANGRKVNAFKLANDGGVPLQLSDVVAVKITGENASDFQVSERPEFVVHGAQSTQFSITFDPDTPGVKNALVTVDFTTAGTYSFAIRGTGLAPTPPWQNPRNRYDVNNDSNVSGLDVLVAVNAINRNGGAYELPPIGPGTSPPPYYDVNGDGRLSGLDTLALVNFINARTAEIVAPLARSLGDAATAGGVLTSVNSAQHQAADLLFTAAWQSAADDLATSLVKGSRTPGRRGLA